MQLIQFFVVLFVSIFSLVSCGMPGGAQIIPNDDSRAVRALEFALTEAYTGVHPTAKITRATSQVVNGVKYELTVEVTDADNKCHVKQFGVWYRGGPPGVLLVENIDLNSQCA